MNLLFLIISEVTTIEYHQHDSPNVSKDCMGGHAKVDRKNVKRPQSYTKLYSQLRKSGSRRGGFPHGTAKQWLSSDK